MEKESMVNIIDRDVLEVIRDRFEDIFPAEKKVAEFILSHPDDAVSYNVAGLAKASGVSDATIIRLCHRLGYSGYYQFRLALSRDNGRKQTQEVSDISPKDPLQMVFERYAEAVASLGRSLDYPVLRECISLMKAAGMVHILAMGNTTNLARYMGFRLERLGIRSSYSELPEYCMNHINLADAGDIVLAISKSGSSKWVIDGMKLAREKKLKTILITAYVNSPAAELADLVLDSRGTQATGTYYKGYSYLNEFLVVETLLDFLVNEERIKTRQSDRPELLLAENKYG